MMRKQCSCGSCGACRAQGTFEILPFAAESGANEMPFPETEELELALELLSVASEEELEQFLGGLLKKAWSGIKTVGSAVAKAAGPLGGVLKGIAKQALPFVGGALGSMIPIPGVGTMIGRAAGSALASALEMEAAGLDPEQAELEMARRFVPRAVHAALQAALRQHVPALGA
jgi:hypothetical protein